MALHSIYSLTRGEMTNKGENKKESVALRPTGF
jgi:hypothetical protein